MAGAETQRAAKAVSVGGFGHTAPAGAQPAGGAWAAEHPTVGEGCGPGGHDCGRWRRAGPLRQRRLALGGEVSEGAV